VERQRSENRGLKTAPPSSLRGTMKGEVEV
jgi:hypothetical protein